MTREEAIKIAKGLRTDFKCESNTMVDFCNTIIKALEQEPTTKNDLGVDKTDMIDKSNFSQEQYKADLQCAYDCGKSVIDKIRAEIEKTKTTMNMFNREDTKQYAIAMEDALKIIDKYKMESEE